RQLLDHFILRQDEVAFAELVRRHGPMVLTACRHVLRHEQDAEDAFQATFLVLARKAGSIRKARSLACWLHGVAHHTAMSARRSANRRRNHEGEAQHMRQDKPSGDLALRELRAVLDEEILHLPKTYQ